MSIPQLNMINSIIKKLLHLVDDLKMKRVERDQVLAEVDELENRVDELFTALVPDRITDERFSAVVKAVQEVTDGIKQLRESIVYSRFSRAKQDILEVQKRIRHAYRLLLLVKSGAPTTIILQTAPQFIREIPVPETLVYSSPIASQIYNILSRRGEASLEELALDLKIDDKTRDEFNRAVSYLITSGYARPYLTPDNKLVLKVSR